MIAIREKHEELAMYLLQNTKVDVKHINKFGWTPITLAIRAEEEFIFNTLLEKGILEQFKYF